MTTRRTLLLVLVASLLGEVVLFLALLQFREFSFQAQFGVAHTRWYALGLLIGTLPLWALSVWLVSKLRLTRRAAAWLVLGVGAVFAVAALLHPPTTSDDDYRYMWDAKVQLHGTDPYRYIPTDPRITYLHDTPVFGACSKQLVHVVFGGCTGINRPFVNTVYPPVAQLSFDTIRLASFGHGEHLPWQLAGAFGSLLIGWLVLRRSPTRPWRAALWTWCPVVVIEFANNAHIDWVAIVLVVLALATARGKWAAGLLVGAAVAVKIYPALVLPALVRRSWWTAVTAVVFVAVSYVPHVIAVGGKVIGYLPGYLKEEQYSSGERFALLSPVLPDRVDIVAAVLILVAAALWAWLRRRPLPDGPARAAADVVGVAFLVTTPAYGWYAGLLLALVALTGALEWVPVVLAAAISYQFYPIHTTASYAVALVLVIVLRVVRTRGWRLRPRPLRRVDAPAATVAATAS